MLRTLELRPWRQLPDLRIPFVWKFLDRSAGNITKCIHFLKDHVAGVGVECLSVEMLSQMPKMVPGYAFFFECTDHHVVQEQV